MSTNTPLNDTQCHQTLIRTTMLVRSLRTALACTFGEDLECGFLAGSLGLYEDKEQGEDKKNFMMCDIVTASLLRTEFLH